MGIGYLLAGIRSVLWLLSVALLDCWAWNGATRAAPPSCPRRISPRARGRWAGERPVWFSLESTVIAEGFDVECFSCLVIHMNLHLEKQTSKVVDWFILSLVHIHTTRCAVVSHYRCLPKSFSHYRSMMYLKGCNCYRNRYSTPALSALFILELWFAIRTNRLFQNRCACYTYWNPSDVPGHVWIRSTTSWYHTHVQAKNSLCFRWVATW